MSNMIKYFTYRKVIFCAITATDLCCSVTIKLQRTREWETYLNLFKVTQVLSLQTTMPAQIELEEKAFSEYLKEDTVTSSSPSHVRHWNLH